MLQSPDSYHDPVLLRECIESLVLGPGLYVDGTLGGGGHSLAILRKLEAEGWLERSLLVGIDQDDEALATARRRLEPFGRSALGVKGNFRDILSLVSGEARRLGMEPAAKGILLDLGVSSRQIDSAGRGFSYMQDGPLDMRMDASAPLSAEDLLRDLDERELASIMFRYGEEPRSRAIARAVVAAREKQGPLQTTKELAEVVRSVVHGRQHLIRSLSRVFQALRIAVNGELDVLRQVLEDGVALLAPGGRMAVISYHSLEDRMVKQFFAKQSECDWGPKGVGLREPLSRGELSLVTRKAVTASEEEVRQNPRARSAKLRVAEKTGGVQ
ncbi:16S rRNA (cytosine(1402)-N(4))-methyltransferase RsmH [Chlorobium sp. N1]|uniref:16S rRNA (cytosine(1402)-N(4))-methyltransferase RsmH n=1 Tax=Chlorobium sp. N1 TaxID=2491138 RepID=UPI001038E856|nr:16S rRNA (cytosine(1402)-N(4))-methyltransferase RsmH [Chlorobium sp. N1]TCD48186.1 16S rRNA (cytosine(1402)-N(4))-methyltransferase RsmH [Chlorobium sp. N1]